MMAGPRRVDINSDVGEGLDDEVLLPYLTSISVACGGHAGDRETMARTLSGARRHGLRAGAHPGYPDRAGFGRTELEISLGDLEASLREQIGTLAGVARQVGIQVTHVKAHGALYNRAWRDRAGADVVARAVLAFDPRALVFCPAGSAQEERPPPSAWRSSGRRSWIGAMARTAPCCRAQRVAPRLTPPRTWMPSCHFSRV